MLAVIGAALIALGLVVLTIAVYGTWRLRGVMPSLHAATKASALGTIAVLLGAIGTGNATTIARAGLVVVLLLLTGTVSSHAIGRAAYRRGVREDDADG